MNEQAFWSLSLSLVMDTHTLKQVGISAETKTSLSLSLRGASKSHIFRLTFFLLFILSIYNLFNLGDSSLQYNNKKYY